MLDRFWLACGRLYAIEYGQRLRYYWPLLQEEKMLHKCAFFVNCQPVAAKSWQNKSTCQMISKSGSMILDKLVKSLVFVGGGYPKIRESVLI